MRATRTWSEELWVRRIVRALEGMRDRGKKKEAARGGSEQRRETHRKKKTKRRKE